MEQKMSALTWGLLALLGLIWGGSFFFARIAVVEVPPLTLVFLRASPSQPSRCISTSAGASASIHC